MLGALISPLCFCRKRLLTTGSLVALLLLSSIGCQIEGGWNENQREPGSGDQGVALSWGEIAVDPGGDYFVSSLDDSLLLVRLDSGEQETILEGLKPARLAFANTRPVIFVAGELDGDEMLIAYDVTRASELWRKRLGSSDDHAIFSVARLNMTVTGDDAHLVLSDRRAIQVHSPSEGTVGLTRSFGDSIEDIDLAGNGRLLVTLETEWDGDTPFTSIVSVSLDTGATVTIEVPNCSDELVLSPDGRSAFLAPTTCVEPTSNRNKDPVSVIDLEKNEFVRNLPGFGPVAMDRAGKRMVAFMDMDNLDRSLFDSPEDVPAREESRYHLMFIEVDDLSFSSLALGDVLPRYALTPDGKMLLIDEDRWLQQMRLRVLDIDSKTMSTISGPDVQLDNFVITSDSSTVYLLDHGLFELSVGEALVNSVAIDFTPSNINITPDDRYLILRQSDTRLWMYDTLQQEICYGVELGVDASFKIEVEGTLTVTLSEEIPD